MDMELMVLTSLDVNGATVNGKVNFSRTGLHVPQETEIKNTKKSEGSKAICEFVRTLASTVMS